MPLPVISTEPMPEPMLALVQDSSRSCPIFELPMLSREALPEPAAMTRLEISQPLLIFKFVSLWFRRVTVSALTP